MTQHKILNPNHFKEELGSSKKKTLIDVRTVDEFKSGTIPDAICIPHDQIQDQVADFNPEEDIYLFCGSGKRSAKACETLKAKGFKNITELEGGFSSWSKQGLSCSRKRKAISIQRQVMISAGFLISLGMALGCWVNNAFYFIAAFVGIGLFFAGLTGFCGMALLLEKMPWNKEN